VHRYHPCGPPPRSRRRGKWPDAHHPASARRASTTIQGTSLIPQTDMAMQANSIGRRPRAPAHVASYLKNSYLAHALIYGPPATVLQTRKTLPALATSPEPPATAPKDAPMSFNHGTWHAIRIGPSSAPRRQPFSAPPSQLLSDPSRHLRRPSHPPVCEKPRPTSSAREKIVPATPILPTFTQEILASPPIDNPHTQNMLPRLPYVYFLFLPSHSDH